MLCTQCTSLSPVAHPPGMKAKRSKPPFVNPEWYHLRDAVEQGDLATAETLLQNNPELLDERNGIGETVLHFLAVEDCSPGVKWLHAKGGSLNTTNEFGTPLLFEVALLGYRDLLLWLLAQGADPKQRDNNGQSLRRYLADFGESDMVAFLDEHITPD
jgi:ankyrin repeat protein